MEEVDHNLQPLLTHFVIQLLLFVSSVKEELHLQNPISLTFVTLGNLTVDGRINCVCNLVDWRMCNI